MNRLVLVAALAAACGSSDRPKDSRPTAPGPTTGTPTGGDTATGTATGSGTGTGTGCEGPTLAPSRGGDASADARAGDPWFEEIVLDGISDDATTTGAAWVDLDGDGDLDALLSREDAVQLWRNDGCFAFAAHPLDAGGATGSGLAGALVADLSGDGLLDLYLPGSGASSRSLLFVADGSWDRFTEQAVASGLDNPGAYVRGGATLGDLDGDGWYDLAVGGHQIGGATGLGRPLSRLWLFRPGVSGWADGSYEDVANSPFAPDFGGSGPSCAPGGEWTGLDATLADLDDDGALDLLWATHPDMYLTPASDPCATGTNPYGLRHWAGQPDGSLVERAEAPGELADSGRMNWNAGFGHYVVGAEGTAPGAESTTLFDFDNDGDRDVLLVGPTDPDWAISADQTEPGQPGTVARLLRNDGGSWTDVTTTSGLDALSWTIGQWAAFFDHPLPASSSVMDLVCAAGPQQPLCAGLSPADRQLYPAHVLALDADNDGFVDLLFTNRQCAYNPGADDDFRSVLLRNQGDGSFAPLTTIASGVVGCGLAAFPTDLDGDGWIDLHLINRDELQQIPDNIDRVLRNRGADLGHAGHGWMELRLAGRPEPELLGARLTALGATGEVLATGWVEREAWRGSREPTVHLGLGLAAPATVEVRLRDGSTASFSPPPNAATTLTL